MRLEVLYWSLFVVISQSTELAADLTPLLTGQYKLADIAGPGNQGGDLGSAPDAAPPASPGLRIRIQHAGKGREQHCRALKLVSGRCLDGGAIIDRDVTEHASSYPRSSSSTCSSLFPVLGLRSWV